MNFVFQMTDLQVSLTVLAVTFVTCGYSMCQYKSMSKKVMHPVHRSVFNRRILISYSRILISY